MKIVPFFGNSIAGKSYPVSRQRRVNCYFDNRPDGDKTKIACYGTPGLSLAFTAPAIVRGMAGSENTLYVVAGTQFYVYNPRTGVSSANFTIYTSSGYVSIAVGPTQVVIVDGAQGYCYNITSNTFTVISAFPATGAKTVTFTGGYFVCEQPGTQQFWVSNLFDGSTWNALAFASASQYSDNLLACRNLIGNLVLMSEQHIEFWQNVGTIPEPFAPILAATAEYGLTAIFSVGTIDNSMIVLCENKQGTTQVVRLIGYQTKIISTPDLESVFATFASDQVNAVAVTYVVNGHPMYQITFPTADTGTGRSFLYDCATDLWSETQTGLTQNYAARHQANLSSYSAGNTYVSDYASGKIFTYSDTTYTDGGSTILREVVCRHISEGFNVLGIDEVLLDMETGVGLNSGQGINPQISLEVSKDNGRTWGTPQVVNLGALGAYATRVIWRRFGSGRDIMFRIRMTDPVKFVITEAAMTLRARPQ